MNVKAGSTFGIGMVAAAVMTVVLALVRAVGLTGMNLGMMLGAMITQDVGSTTWILGFVIHLLAGGCFALIYAAIFEAWGGSGVGRGMAIAAVHTVAAGALMGVLPAIHPAIPEHPELSEPGFLVLNYGAWSAAGFVVLHLLYGAIVGAYYHRHQRLAMVRNPREKAA